MGLKAVVGVKIPAYVAIDPLSASLLASMPRIPMWIALGTILPTTLVGALLYQGSANGAPVSPG